ncbi:MAG: hypothetical protein GC146_06830 [Limimaricola sp.]|uniref:hypothetical protein n=1 Tax=Limimaricola sp. TaxID=2211665 RepID=UPI001D3B7D3A|nr:hypothetical protein [Limimaricola sp.]MBI1416918.1 hypothetical protein [Limimaricola sp.]
MQFDGDGSQLMPNRKHRGDMPAFLNGIVSGSGIVLKALVNFVLPQASGAREAAASLRRQTPAKMYAPDLHRDLPLFVLGGPEGAFSDCVAWIEDQGLQPRWLSQLPQGAGLADLPRSTMLLVDIDFLGGIVRVIDQLIELRRQRRDIIVILMSTEFGRHTLDQTRLAVADVSLRLPCSFASLELALTEAELNNDVWRQRELQR